MTVNVMFHADLSDAHQAEEHWLSVQGQRYELIPHTDETRAAARASDPSMATVSDTSLTHYTNPVPMPDAQVIRVHVRHTLSTFPGGAGQWAASHAAIHIPPPVSSVAAPMDRRLAPMEAAASPRNIAAPMSAPLPRPNLAPPMHLDYVSTAQALLFHHADLINIDPTTTRTIYGHMQNDANISHLINNLAQTMRDAGPPSPTGGWALQVPFTPPANPDTGIDGTTTYYYTDPTDATRAAAGPAMTALMVATKNDLSLRGVKWQQQAGTSVESAAAAPQEQSQSRALASESATISTASNGTWTASVANSASVHGLQVSLNVTDAASRTADLTLNNNFIRYLGAFIRFYDATGSPIFDKSWFANDSAVTQFIISELGYDNHEVHFLGIVGPVDNIMAIPIESEPGTLTVSITFPPTAVSASVYGSGIGTGSNPWPSTPALGGVLTGVFNLGVPAFLLAFQVAAQSNKPLYDIVKGLTSSPLFISGVIVGGLGYFAANSAIQHKVSWRALQPLGSLLFNVAAGKALKWVESTTVTQKAVEEIPFAGWIMVAIDIAVGAAQIAETIVEVATSPWNIENTIATSVTTTATVYPDPRQQAFPAGADASYVVRMIYKDAARPSVVLPAVSVAAGSSAATLLASFPNNTLGGMIKIEADYFIGQWMAATATTGWIANDDADVENVNLYLVENPVPLNAQSIYQHASLLTYQNGAYTWQATANAPTATLTNNSNSASNAINIWSGLSLSQRHAMLGFAWQAFGTGLASCRSLQTGDLYTLQSVQIPGFATNIAKFPSCAFDGQTQVAYDSYPPKFLMVNGNWALGSDGKPVADPTDVQVGSYYIDPSNGLVVTEAGGGYHLRRITLDATTPLQVNPPSPSYGRFPYYPDSIALHPSGHVIGVSRLFAKIQVTALQADPGVADIDAPVAQTYSGTAVDPQRPGLLFTPIAVSCSYDGTIFILENLRQSSGSNAQVIARIQAFDLYANSVNRFFDGNGAPSPFLQLPASAEVTYLDLVVIGTNAMTYFYVLYYNGDGSTPADYQVAIYQYGATAPAQNPLATTGTVPAARLAVDMWRTLYTLNYDMVTDGHGNHAGPVNSSTGPAGRTVPSVSQWLPPVPGQS